MRDIVQASNIMACFFRFFFLLLHRKQFWKIFVTQMHYGNLDYSSIAQMLLYYYQLLNVSKRASILGVLDAENRTACTSS